MLFRKATRLISALSLCLCLASPLFGQDTNASLSGTVTDTQGAGIGGATVTVTNTATGVARTLQGDTNGRYNAANLPPGPYQLEVNAPGFSRKQLTGIILTVSQSAAQDVQLPIGQATDTVTVEAGQNLTQTESSEVGTLIDNKKVVEMPLANRQFYSLALLSPGAYPSAQSSTLGFRGGFNVSGASESTNLFTYNGVYNDAIGTQQPAYRPSVETIQEFKLLTGVYGAQYGKYSGAQVIVLEKSGTNQFHGSAYEFIRNEVANAKPYFTAIGNRKPAFRQNTFGATIGGPIRKDKTFFFGGYEGQRVNSQTTQRSTVPSSNMLNGIFPTLTQNNNGTTTATTLYNPYTGVPLTRQANGTYNLAEIPQWSGAAAQLGRAFASYYPSSNPSNAGLAPTAANLYPSSNFTYSAIQVEKMDEYTVRIDHTISGSDNLTASYNEFHDPTYQPSNILCGLAGVPYGGCDFNQIVHLATFQEAHVFSPTLLNTLTFGYNRFQMPRLPEDRRLTNLPVLPGAFINPTPENTGLPNLAPSGYATLGGPTNIPQNQWLNQYELYDSANWTHGAHSFQFGLDTFLAITTEVFTQNGRGAATFNAANIRSNNACTTSGLCYGTTGNSMADFLLGVPYTTTRNPVAPNVHEGNFNIFAYAVDDWKIKRNLTLNLGLRYELNSPAYDSKNQISRYNPSSGLIELGNDVAAPTDPTIARLVDAGTRFKYLYNWDANNFAPRVGFSWQPFNKESSVVKGAYGIFYNGPIQFNQYITASTQLPVRTPQTFTAATVTPGNVSLSFASPFTGGSAGSYTAFGAEPKQPTPYIQEWSLGVQQQLSNTIVAEITYVGSKGTHLPNAKNINSIPISVPFAQRAQARRPDTKFANVTYSLDSGTSSFHSLQTSLRKNLRNGTSFLMAYTWAKSFDQNPGIGAGSNSTTGFQDPRNPQADRGLSDFDVRHRLVFSPVYELPFGKGKALLNHGIGSAVLGGFQISGIIAYQTGRPFTVVDNNTNRTLTFAGADRPNVVQGQNPNSGPKTVAQWFNTAAFQDPQPSDSNYRNFGNAGRNAVRGPDNVQIDMTVARQFPIHESVVGQLRVEAFNLPNHPNFYNPYGAAQQLGSTTFGQITNSYDPRQLQAAVRILF